MKRDSSSSDAKASGARVHPLDWARIATAEDLVEREMTACVRQRSRRRTATAGALMLVALVSVSFFWWQRNGALVLSNSHHRAYVSLPARQELPDGSIVDLKGGAQINVDYGGLLRRVTLLQGEAHFQVAKNHDRPFVVTAGGVDVHAVGTAFLVQLEQTGVEVVVTEGQVAVDAAGESEKTESKGKASVPSPTPKVSSILVGSGNRVSIDTVSRTNVLPPAVQPVAAAELAERLAWRVPRLEFDSTPLSEVIPIFNQYANVQLSYSDPELGKLKLSGVLRGNNVAVLLQILESSYSVKAEQRTPNEIVLHR